MAQHEETIAIRDNETTSLLLELSKLKASMKTRDGAELHAKQAEITSLRDQVRQSHEQIRRSNDRNVTLEAATQAALAEKSMWYNAYANLRGTIRVVVRIRPPSLEPASRPDTEEEQQQLWTTRGKNILAVADKEYTFDRILSPYENNSAVFREIEPLLQGAVDGRSALIFAYGASGSGKTYTLDAIQRSAAERLFAMLSNSGDGEPPVVLAACTAVYCTKMQDLLCDGDRPRYLSHPKTKALTGLPDETTLVPVRSASELVAELDRARRKSVKAPTKLNGDSSRGHTLFTIVIPPSSTFSVSSLLSSKYIPYRSIQDRLRGARYITFLDLAGNEDVKQSGVTGERFEEAKAINASLSALKTVLGQMNRAEKVTWKESLLTMLIGGLTGGAREKGTERVDVLMLTMLDLGGRGSAGLKGSLKTLEFAEMVSNSLCTRKQSVFSSDSAD